MAGNENSGKRVNQKLVPYIILQYLMKNSDADHMVSTKDIIDYLTDDCGIEVDRRTVYSAVKEINRVNRMLEDECTMDEADEMLEEDDTLKMIVTVTKGRNSGFYVQNRHFSVDDIRLLAQCIYFAKFVTPSEEERLTEAICEFISEPQAEDILLDCHLVGRTRTKNKYVTEYVYRINTAMSRRYEGKQKPPEKISFKYLKADIDNLEQLAERRKGEPYIVSPYKLLINDGNFYLLAFDDKSQKMRTYRVDRMKAVKRLEGVPRDGEEEFEKIDLESFTQRVFNMYGGERHRVTLRFINKYLDAIVDRFGTKNASYSKVDNRHFQVMADVEVSPQFFGWLFGYGKGAKILDPAPVVEQYQAYLDSIRAMY